MLASLKCGASAAITVSRVARGLNEHSLEVYGEQGALAMRQSRTGTAWHLGELRSANTCVISRSKMDGSVNSVQCTMPSGRTRRPKEPGPSVSVGGTGRRSKGRGVRHGQRQATLSGANSRAMAARRSASGRYSNLI